MEDRGEETAGPGGSHSSAASTPTYSTANSVGHSRTRNSTGIYYSEGFESSSASLPLRKRKFPFIDITSPRGSNQEGYCAFDLENSSSNIPLNLSTSSSIDFNTSKHSVGKSSHSTSSNRAVVFKDSGFVSDISLLPASKRPRKDKDSPLSSGEPNRYSSPSLAAQTSTTPSKSAGVVSPVPTRRRSSRGSYPIGFYAEEEQKSLAAFRDRTSELRSKGDPPEVASSNNEDKKKTIRNSKSQDIKHTVSYSSSSSRGRSGWKGGNQNRVRKKKMTEKNPSWNNEGATNNLLKEPLESESVSVLTESNKKSKTIRRHTLPGRKEASADMGVTLSKCLALRTHSNTLELGTNDPRPSTSGLSNASVLDGSPKMFDLIRRLPVKKKSNSEQDLSHFESCIPSSNTEEPKGSKSDKLPVRKYVDVKRRKSTNLEKQQERNSLINKEKNDTEDSSDTQTSDKSPSFFKLYPLRSRLRLSDGANQSSSTAGNNSTSGNNLNDVLHYQSRMGAVPPSAHGTDAHHYTPLNHPTVAQTQSLPSSPSSTGATLLDAFRRFRDSRRLSHEHSSQVPSPNTRKGQNQTHVQESKQLSAPWKRGHALKKSPLSSKRSGRVKSNSVNYSNSSQHSGKSVGSGIGHQFPNMYRAQGLPSAQNFLQMAANSTGAPLPIPPSSIADALSTPPSNLGGSGANSTGGATSGSSASLGASSLDVTGALGGLIGNPGDSESEENEVDRLEALLASRGLPPNIFGALGPRVQHILHRSVSSSISSKAQQLLIGLQSTGDESEQLQAAIAMSQLLVMGNEDTLAGFPIKQVTSALINLLNMEHNFDMMIHASRALTYMMEALPRSSTNVVDAIPVFLEKLQVIQCMDVAEQSLTALHMLSRKHSKAILQAHGVSACLTYIDFFSINPQRAALGITANCFQNLMADEFHFAADSLSILSSRLTTQGDKKCVESVCLAYSHLVDCFQNDPNRLQEIAEHNLIPNIQQLLVISPPVLSSNTFIMVMRMLSMMCSNCPELAVSLLNNNIAQTLCYLLTNSTDLPLEQVELVPRIPKELYEITCLIGELLPVLPSDGIFLIDSSIQRPHISAQEIPVWQWQDDRGTWHNYSPADSRVIELAHQLGEDEISLGVNGRAYTLDFQSMQQINDNTSTSRSVQRRMIPGGSGANLNLQVQAIDARAKCLKGDEELSSNLIKTLFSLLYEVYSSSGEPAVRYKCLRALLRMVHFSSPELLQQVIKSQAVSSHLATMLSSLDLKIIVGALQMAELLMEKLPQIFAVFFRREGVMHQIKRLCDADAFTSSTSAPLSKNTSPSLSENSSSGSILSCGSNSNLLSQSSSPLLLSGSHQMNGSIVDSSTTGVHDDDKLNSPSQRISDVLKRKRPKGRVNASSVWKRGIRQAESSPGFSEMFLKNTGFISGRDSWKGIGNKAKTFTGGNGSNNSSSGGSGRAASILSNFNLIRWGRCANPTPTPEVHQTKEKSSGKSLTITNSTASSMTTSSNIHTVIGVPSNTTNSNREYIRNWIREQAQKLNDKYFTMELQGSSHPALTVLNRLIAAINGLEKDNVSALSALSEISKIVKESDISPFEVIHSGLVTALLNYLTSVDRFTIKKLPSAPSDVFISNDESMLNVLAMAAGASDPLQATAPPVIPREQRLRNFLHVFLGSSLNPLTCQQLHADQTSSFSALISKLNGCVNQLEQFPVKVHDLPGSAISGSGRGSSTSAIKFFTTHQLKCNLQRHPDCNRLKQWRNGPVKVDPLALVQAIEKYLIARSYHRLRNEDDDNSDDDNSDEDFDDTLAAVSINQNPPYHKLEFLIGDHVLPYNMTVYQAIRQYSAPTDASVSETETDTEMPISHSSIWLQTHVIYYRNVQEETTRPPIRKGKSGSKSSPKKKGDILYSETAVIGGSTCALDGHLSPYLPRSVTVRDPSLEVLALLRVLFTLNRNYGSLYPPSISLPALPILEFTNMKLTAKANRQLQDPLVIMTGNLPQWLSQIAYACPFLFPFETRQLLFYAVSFDRDRALQRLIDSTPELHSSDSSERVTPRLERRKRTVSRDDILKQAESVINDLASSRAMLEIQYENEVGTGLGPTLEFYALVSKELQKADLELWRGDSITVEESNTISSKAVKYISTHNGLYPLPIPRNMKSAYLSKLKAKFKFLGKFMAKAVMDSRMLDVGLHTCAYKWLLGEERSLGLGDVISLDPTLGQTLSKLQAIALDKKAIQDKCQLDNLSDSQVQEKIGELTIDGCKVEDLALNFTLPGHSNIELLKGGADMELTINNVEQYLHLVVEWIIREGVWRQMESFKEGFEAVFPLTQLQIFYPEELEQLFCGTVDCTQWDIKQLVECCRPDHGYTHNSKAVKYLLQILSEYTSQQQRSFLQFVTGSPRLPVGGFKSLTPPLTIVRKTFESSENPDKFLPSVMTCVNYLKLPDYSTIEIMKEKLSIASKEGQHTFHLS